MNIAAWLGVLAVIVILYVLEGGTPGDDGFGSFLFVILFSLVVAGVIASLW